MAERYVQVGVTAMRDRATGKFLPSIPLYARESDLAPGAEEQMLRDFARLIARDIKAHRDSQNAGK